jgi:hypothetical protein
MKKKEGTGKQKTGGKGVLQKKQRKSNANSMRTAASYLDNI